MRSKRQQLGPTESPRQRKRSKRMQIPPTNRETVHVLPDNETIVPNGETVPVLLDNKTIIPLHLSDKNPQLMYDTFGAIQG